MIAEVLLSIDQPTGVDDPVVIDAEFFAMRVAQLLEQRAQERQERADEERRARERAYSFVKVLKKLVEDGTSAESIFKLIRGHGL
jgi:hypothetical protein